MPGRPDIPSKPCASCGRSFTWRKKWERDWENVRYCSQACSRRGVRDLDTRLEDAILSLLASRSPTASICPSEVARQVDPAAWQELMEPVRRAARRLVVQGRVLITQGGTPVDADRAKGPIRIKAVQTPMR